MKLPRYTASTSTQLPKLQTPQLPKPRMVQPSTQRYQPVTTPSQVLQQAEQEAQFIGNMVSGATTALAALDESISEAQATQASQKYLHASMQGMNQITNLPLYEETVDPVTGVIQRSRPWEDAQEVYQTQMNVYAESLTEGMTESAKIKFGTYRSGVDAKNTQSIYKYQQDKKVDEAEYLYEGAMADAIASNDTVALGEIGEMMINTGYWDAGEVIKRVQKGEDQISAGIVQNLSEVVTRNRDSIGQGVVDQYEEIAYDAIAQIQSPEIRRKMMNEVIKWDDYPDERIEKAQKKRTNSLITALILGDQVAAENTLRKALEDPNADALYGDEMPVLHTLYKSMQTAPAVSVPEVSGEAESIVQMAIYNGAGHNEARRQIGELVGQGLSWDEHNALVGDLNNSQSGGWDKEFRDLSRYWYKINGLKADGESIWSTATKNNVTQGEWQVMRQVERLIKNEVELHGRDGTLRTWINSGAGDKFVDDILAARAPKKTVNVTVLGAKEEIAKNSGALITFLMDAKQDFRDHLNASSENDHKTYRLSGGKMIKTDSGFFVPSDPKIRELEQELLNATIE